MKCKFVIYTLVFILSFSTAIFAADETATEKLDENINVETDQRGMTFFKVEIENAAKSILQFPEYYDILINKIIHPGVKLPRFDVDIVPPGMTKNISKEQFILKLKDYYENNIKDILDRRQKARGKGYRDEHREFVRTEAMFQQVRDSAYVYGISLIKFRLVRKEETRQVTKTNPDGTKVKVPEVHWYWIGELEYRINFWKFKMPKGKSAYMEFVDKIGNHRDAKNEIMIVPIPTHAEMNAQGLNAQQKKQKIQEAKKRQEQEILNTRDETWGDVIPSYDGIEKSTKEIFPYISKIVGSTNGNRELFIRAGKKEGFKVDDGFYIIDSNKKELGYTKLRHLGIGFVEAGDGATKAYSDQSKLQLIKGDEGKIGTGLSVLENPMSGFEFTLTFGYNLTLGTEEATFDGLTDSVTFEDATGGGFSLTMQFLYDVGAGAGIPELWFGVDLNAVLGGNTYLFADLVIMKRSYTKQFNLEYGAGIGGIAALISGESDNNFEDVSATIVGLAVRINLGIGYFISPSFELYARADVRLAITGELEEIDVNEETWTLSNGGFSLPLFNIAIELGFRFPF